MSNIFTDKKLKRESLLIYNPHPTLIDMACIRILLLAKTNQTIVTGARFFQFLAYYSFDLNGKLWGTGSKISSELL